MELTHESLSIDNMGVVSSVLLCIPLFWVNDLSHGARSQSVDYTVLVRLCIPLTACEHLRYINIECPLLPDPVPCFVRNSQCPELLLISAKELPLFSSIDLAL